MWTQTEECWCLVHAYLADIKHSGLLRGTLRGLGFAAEGPPTCLRDGGLPQQMESRMLFSQAIERFPQSETVFLLTQSNLHRQQCEEHITRRLKPLPCCTTAYLEDHHARLK